MSTDREALARSVREKARSAICRATGQDLQGDNLGIALLTHISPAHPDEEDDDCGWPLSAVDAVNAIFDDAIANLLSAGWMPREALSDPNAVHVSMLSGRIARPTPEQIIHIYGADVLARAAGWMPRPKPGSPEWEAMVERAINEGENADLCGDPTCPQCLRKVGEMLRAALGTGDKTGPEARDGR